MRETVNLIQGVYIKNCRRLIPDKEITSWLSRNTAYEKTKTDTGKFPCVHL